MRWTHLPACEYRRERWANGAGWTREILRSPQSGSDAFDWRLSIAEIDKDSDYSSFPGCEREQVLLSGNGLDLHVGAALHSLRPAFGRLRFSGEAEVHAHLTDGPVRAFNLIWRHRVVQPSVLIRPLVGPMVFFDESDVDWVLHLVSGRAELKDVPACPKLEAGDCLWLGGDATEPRRCILDGAGYLIAARLGRRAAPDS